MTTRRHRMPFGAELTADGVRFRLWAPAAKRVDLVLSDDGRRQVLAMAALEGGWFELATAAAHTGSRYRFRIDGHLEVPDPASRLNPDDVHGPSVVVDPESFPWPDGGWRAPPWHEAIVYELHVGTFTPEGTFAGVQNRLPSLRELGVNVLELMPIADFPGSRGWGYDGVLPFAPDAAYGTPAELKSLLAAAHELGMAVMLDVVYNHFGPEGNFLHAYAPQFFSERHTTPWGAAINFDGPGSRTVRDFYLANTLYWLEEYHFDGLRFDAVHAICDDSPMHVLTQIATAARRGPGAKRPIYLVLENGANQAAFLGPEGGATSFDAQWNDDIHHCLHVILTGETDGYYADYADRPHARLCRGLADGFVYQGESSVHESGRPRGEPSAHLPPTAFVSFLQNHDQIGNRAFGDRLAHAVDDDAALLAAVALLLLMPQIPLLFMGEEWAASAPFPYFCDFEPELAAKVREGRRREFERFKSFGGDPGAGSPPDPLERATFDAAHLDWAEREAPRHARFLEHYRRLIAIRRRDIIPCIGAIGASRCAAVSDDGAVMVDWSLADGAQLHLLANLNPRSASIANRPAGRLVFSTHPNVRATQREHGTELPPWNVSWLLERGAE